MSLLTGCKRDPAPLASMTAVAADAVPPRYVVLLVLALVATLIAGCGRTQVSAECKMTVLGTVCTFHNVGTERASACASVVVRNRNTDQSLRSLKTCSPTIERSSSWIGGVNFSGSPLDLCMPDFDACSLNVEVTDVKAESLSLEGLGGTWTSVIALAIVIITSLFVLVDATWIGARRGLGLGLADLGPGGWFLSCLFMWIVAFPYYVMVRPKIVRRALVMRRGMLFAIGDSANAQAPDGRFYDVVVVAQQDGHTCVRFPNGATAWLPPHALRWPLYD